MSSSSTPPSFFQRLSALLSASTSNRYTQANTVYLFYVSIIMFINLSLSKKANAVYTDDVYYSSETSSYIMWVPTPLHFLHFPLPFSLLRPSLGI